MNGVIPISLSIEVDDTNHDAVMEEDKVFTTTHQQRKLHDKDALVECKTLGSGAFGRVRALTPTVAVKTVPMNTQATNEIRILQRIAT